MTAVRLARAATGRPKIIKFTGGYHGHVDALLVSAGSGATTLGTPSSPGIPDQTTQDTLSCPYNDSDALTRILEAHPNQIAGVMLEPICGNMGLVLPEPTFLSTLTALCKKHGVLVIFDEVMTGFRVALGGAQSLYNCTPDLTVLGKIIGGGMPVGAIGGKKSLLSLLAPCGPVYQAGTLSGNPVTCAAGLATLDILAREHDRIYLHLNDYTTRLTHGLSASAARHGIALQTSSIGGMFGFFFTPNPVTNYSQACSANTDQFTQFFHNMIAQGVYFAPSAFEAGFASTCHGDHELTHTLTAADQAFSCMAR
jgi:glutamate-1-semialdehyde 2,1-aminomutase